MKEKLKRGVWVVVFFLWLGGTIYFFTSTIKNKNTFIRECSKTTSKYYPRIDDDVFKNICLCLWNPIIERDPNYASDILYDIRYDRKYTGFFNYRKANQNSVVQALNNAGISIDELKQMKPPIK